MMGRPERFEHHLIVVGSTAGTQLEITTASEPLYFAHINISDEFAIALPTGDELVDRFPLRTFLTDAKSGEDVGRYNHRTGDLVMHPVGLLHWPGRLRPPYEPFEFPPGMRRNGLSLVYCASKPTASSWVPVPPPSGRDADLKAYAAPGPPMMIAATRSAPGPLATIGETKLVLVEAPAMIAPKKGGWVVVLEATAQGAHAAGDLLRLAPGAKLEAAGITRALLLESEDVAPDPVPPSWAALPELPFAPYEDAPAGELPFARGGVEVADADGTHATFIVGERRAEVPRYWLARMLYRIALHGVRLGYVETYGGVFFDDREDAVLVGIRDASGRSAVTIERADALRFVEDLYRAVAPKGYTERPS
jgi:hypothetical protein